MFMSTQATIRETGRAREGSKVANQRTSVSLTPEAVEILERYKNAKGISASAAVNDLILSSEPKPSRLKEVNGFLVLDIPYTGKMITLEDVKRTQDEMDLEDYRRSLSLSICST